MSRSAVAAISLVAAVWFLSGTARAQLTWQRFYGSSPEANAVREHFAFGTRDFITGRGRDFVPTSGHRGNSGAHENGAFDYRSRELTIAQRHTEARELSQALGPHAQVIAEEYVAIDPGVGSLAASATGPVAAQTTYVNGVQGNTRFVTPGKDFAPHTHVQPSGPAAEVATALGLTPTTGSEARFAELTAVAPPSSSVPSSPMSGQAVSFGNFGFPSFDLGLGSLTPDGFAEGVIRAILSGGRAVPGFGGGGAGPGLGGGPGPRQPQVVQPQIRYPEVIVGPLL